MHGTVGCEHGWCAGLANGIDGIEEGAAPVHRWRLGSRVSVCVQVYAPLRDGSAGLARGGSHVPNSDGKAYLKLYDVT
ncbi:protein of unknown function [Paraburkholderia dioscoreae]|uniref:Uncharacterized protein n=1 Tax=Paraburkholderia dioscoreae TaxID=2604047 RepID=A0A5Q4ZHA9_9BURK|nr:protein of unknown function [Paraburkholderia dioscoreae]